MSLYNIIISFPLPLSSWKLFHIPLPALFQIHSLFSNLFLHTNKCNLLSLISAFHENVSRADHLVLANLLVCSSLVKIISPNPQSLLLYASTILNYILKICPYTHRSLQSSHLIKRLVFTTENFRKTQPIKRQIVNTDGGET